MKVVITQYDTGLWGWELHKEGVIIQSLPFFSNWILARVNSFTQQDVDVEIEVETRNYGENQAG